MPVAPPPPPCVGPDEHPIPVYWIGPVHQIGKCPLDKRRGAPHAPGAEAGGVGGHKHLGPESDQVRLGRVALGDALGQIGNPGGESRATGRLAILRPSGEALIQVETRLMSLEGRRPEQAFHMAELGEARDPGADLHADSISAARRFSLRRSFPVSAAWHQRQSVR